MKAVIFILVLLLVATIEMIVLLYRAYKKLANSQILGGLKMAEYLSKEDMSTGEYISRDEALKAMQYCCKNCDNYNGAMCRACNNADEMDIICDIPAADVQPVKRGKWVYYKNNGIWDIHKCTVCGTPFELPMEVVPSSVFCYCPHCGADMRGEDNG